MRKILFPTDFSETAENAYIYALKVAQNLGASLVTLHVYERPDVRGAHLPNLLQQVYDDIELEEFENYRDQVPYLQQIAAEFKLENVPVVHVMLEGDTVPAIIQIAEEEKAELIIMGTKGASDLREAFLGSITTKVIAAIKTCPVLAIPDIAVFDGKLDKIAIATNYKSTEQEALRYLLLFAKYFGADLHCLHVDISNTEMYTDRMHDFTDVFRNEPHLHAHILDGSDLEKTIEKWLNENQIDMLAMVNHERGWWSRLFENNYTKMFVNHSNVPILAIPVRVLEYQLLQDFTL